MKSVHLISNFLDLKLMSSQVLKATRETEIYFQLPFLKCFMMMYSEFQYSLGSDCKSNYLQKFEVYCFSH